MNRDRFEEIAGVGLVVLLFVAAAASALANRVEGQFVGPDGSTITIRPRRITIDAGPYAGTRGYQRGADHVLTMPTRRGPLRLRPQGRGVMMLDPPDGPAVEYYPDLEWVIGSR